LASCPRTVKRRPAPHRSGDTGVLRHHGGDRAGLGSPLTHRHEIVTAIRVAAPRLAHGCLCFGAVGRLCDLVLPLRSATQSPRHSATWGDRSFPGRSFCDRSCDRRHNGPTHPATWAYRLLDRAGDTDRVVAQTGNDPVRGPRARAPRSCCLSVLILNRRRGTPWGSGLPEALFEHRPGPGRTRSRSGFGHRDALPGRRPGRPASTVREPGIDEHSADGSEVARAPC